MFKRRWRKNKRKNKNPFYAAAAAATASRREMIFSTVPSRFVIICCCFTIFRQIHKHHNRTRGVKFNANPILDGETSLEKQYNTTAHEKAIHTHIYVYKISAYVHENFELEGGKNNNTKPHNTIRYARSDCMRRV